MFDGGVGKVELFPVLSDERGESFFVVAEFPCDGEVMSFLRGVYERDQ